MEPSTFETLRRRALAVRREYADLERRRYGRAWTGQEIVLGFVGDVGDLAKLLLAESGVRDIPGARAALAHELADCLWSLIVLADVYGVDLEQAFADNMDALHEHIGGQLAALGAQGRGGGPPAGSAGPAGSEDG